jgi:glycosyltransferase involved in cell wall biosynthesis
MGYLGNFLPLLLDYRGVDVVVAHGESCLLPLLGKPVLRVMHGSALAEALSATSPWRFLHQLGVYAQELVTALCLPGCVAVSQSTRRYNGFVRHVIPNGVDTDVFHPAATAKAADPTVLFVGTLQGRKRGSLLLEWFGRHVRPRHPTAALWMVSEPGPERPGVQYFHGVTRAELARLYRRAWVYASPSRYEGFGLPYAEAMASGTPVVASPNPGSQEVLGEGRFGVLADDAHFADAVNRLLTDGAGRQEWGRRGLERARQLSRRAMIDHYEELLGELCHVERRAAREPVGQSELKTASKMVGYSEGGR